MSTTNAGPQAELLPVAEIVVRDRARKAVGNVLGLAESVRRLAAVKKLGWTEVPCHVVASLDEAVAALQAERDENTCREPMTPAEVVDLGRRIEELEKPKAAARMKAGRKAETEPCGKLPQGETGKTRDK